MHVMTKVIYAFAVLVPVTLLTGCNTVPSKTTELEAKRASDIPAGMAYGDIRGAKSPRNYSIIPDPTGTAVSPTVEKFVLEPGDCAGKDCTGRYHAAAGTRGTAYRERVEKNVYAGKTGYGKGSTVWYGMDVFIPEEYKDVFNVGTNNTVTIGQVKMAKYGGSDEVRASGSLYELGEPSMMLTYKGGNIRANFYPDDVAENLHTISIAKLDDVVGKWTRYEWVINWSTKEDGFFKIYVNGRLATEYEGRTTRYNRPSSTLTYGIYATLRDFTIEYYLENPSASLPKRMVYIDNPSIAKSRDALFPEQTSVPVLPDIAIKDAVLADKDPNWKPLKMGTVNEDEYKDNIGNFDPSKFSNQVE